MRYLFARFITLLVIAIAWCPPGVLRRAVRIKPAPRRTCSYRSCCKKPLSSPLERIAITIQPPAGENWALGRITSLAFSHYLWSMAYVMMRDDAAHPVIVVDRTGRVIRSWGNGVFQVPHNIAVDPDGNVWTTMWKQSTIQKFTPDGEKLQEFSIDGGPKDCATREPRAMEGGFCGITDLIFISVVAWSSPMGMARCAFWYTPLMES